MGKHVMEALGRTRVVFEDGKVVEVGKPMIDSCPLFKDHRGIDRFDEANVRQNMEYRVEHFGMCTEKRQIRMHDFLNFGVSELMCMCLKDKIFDAAVIVADGCGTVVVEDPEIVQGLGGRISGIVETSPIESVIEGVGRDRVLDPDRATIEQFDGVGKAFQMHYDKVGVTVTTAKCAQEIRDCFGRNVVIFAVHTTGTSEKDARQLFDFCDIITACASKTIRETAKNRAKLQTGTKIPIYAATETGEEIMRARLKELGREPDSGLGPQPEPLL
jgi:putative methanogenesis marker protein 8